MKSPTFRIMLSAILLVLSIEARSQFILGYTGAYLPAHELNRDIYVYDAINRAGLKKEMPAAHLFKGPALGFRKSFDDGYLELMWTRKVATTTSEFDSAGVPFQRQMKFTSTTFNWGFAFGRGGFHAGLSFDFGFCKAKGKRGATDGFKNLDWVYLATPMKFLRLVNRALPDANTVWVETDLGKLVSLRLYAQLFWFKTDFNSEKTGWTVESWLFSSNLNWYLGPSDRLNSFGAALYIKLGKG